MLAYIADTEQQQAGDEPDTAMHAAEAPAE